MKLTWATETDPRVLPWVNAVLNSPPFLLPMQFFISLVQVVLFYVDQRRGKLVFLRADRGEDPQLFTNGALSFRVAFPCYVNFMVRWSGSLTAPSYLQSHFGWKRNGRIILGPLIVLLPLIALMSRYGQPFETHWLNVFGLGSHLWLHWWYVFFLAIYRVQDDKGAAAGVLAPNTDQSAGWIEGGK